MSDLFRRYAQGLLVAIIVFCAWRITHVRPTSDVNALLRAVHDAEIRCAFRSLRTNDVSVIAFLYGQGFDLDTPYFDQPPLERYSPFYGSTLLQNAIGYPSRTKYSQELLQLGASPYARGYRKDGREGPPCPYGCMLFSVGDQVVIYEFYWFFLDTWASMESPEFLFDKGVEEAGLMFYISSASIIDRVLTTLQYSSRFPEIAEILIEKGNPVVVDFFLDMPLDARLPDTLSDIAVQRGDPEILRKVRWRLKVQNQGELYEGKYAPAIGQ